MKSMAIKKAEKRALKVFITIKPVYRLNYTMEKFI